MLQMVILLEMTCHLWDCLELKEKEHWNALDAQRRDTGCVGRRIRKMRELPSKRKKSVTGGTKYISEHSVDYICPLSLSSIPILYISINYFVVTFIVIITTIFTIMISKPFQYLSSMLCKTTELQNVAGIFGWLQMLVQWDCVFFNKPNYTLFHFAIWDCELESLKRCKVGMQSPQACIGAYKALFRSTLLSCTDPGHQKITL